jgi:hypothetical protein
MDLDRPVWLRLPSGLFIGYNRADIYKLPWESICGFSKMNKMLTVAVSGLIFLSLLLSFYAIHIFFLPVNVIFYSAILDGILACIVMGIFVFFSGIFIHFTSFEKWQWLLICFLFSYIFAISVPTVIDRSLSLYILEKIQQRGGGIQKQRFEEVFTREYVKEHRLMDVRLTEQLQSGTIVIQQGCVQLTAKGHWVAKFSRYFRQHWLAKKRLLMQHYSDDLTDPFRYSIPSPGYECGKKNASY